MAKGTEKNSSSTSSSAPFEHEALVYRGEADFITGTVPYLLEGLERGEKLCVAVPQPRLGALRDALGTASGEVRFADMSKVGHNPARIISFWLALVAARDEGRSVRGIGEPIWRGRTPEETVECQRHEALLNFAFADLANLRILCTYGADELSPEVIEEVHLSHPWVRGSAGRAASARCDTPGEVSEHFGDPLEPSPANATSLSFDGLRLHLVRRTVAEAASEAGLQQWAVQEIVAAVNEIATNTVKHGGGRGSCRFWSTARAFVCQVDDAGRITDPLVGRIEPSVAGHGGRGLWIANQLCDLVQIRTRTEGTTVRVHRYV
jgi:anti-sigma regulatory factor (Ser/Thr protein kinase)